MKWFNWSTLSLAALASLASADSDSSSSSSSSSTPPIIIDGNKFFYSNNGSQFYIKGVAYQSDQANATADQSFIDPLADGSICKRDLPYLQELHTNVLRVYALNVSLSHDDCMKTFSDAGIYVIADLSEPGLSIDRTNPEWSVALQARYQSVVDDMQKYDNVLGFFAGNEVTNNDTNTDASPFVKAAVRDTKAYIKEKGYRKIPVGYSTNDDADTRLPMAEYFCCGSEDDGRVDFYGINMYEWCGDSSFKASGYQARTEEFKNLNVPLFFSEYGCNRVQPRMFTEVQALYSDEMTDVWSGGIVYMYFEEQNNYGLVTIESGKVSTLDDFNNLASELAKISPTTASTKGLSINTTATACPASTGSYWKANTRLPPTPNQGVCQCASDSAACVLADGIDEKDYGDLFGYLCGQVNCQGIQHNGTSGNYGAFSFCEPKDQLNYLLNLYYEKEGMKSAACDFSGSASLNDSPKTASACSAVLNQAGSAGTGVISADISGSYTGAVEGNGSGSPNGAAAVTSSTSSNTEGHKKSGASLATPSYGLVGAVAVAGLMGVALVI